MIELSLSMVAWISVVLVQAVIHLIILPRSRQQQLEEEQSLVAEETDSETESSTAATAGTTEERNHFLSQVESDAGMDERDTQDMHRSSLLEDQKRNNHPELVLRCHGERTHSETRRSPPSAVVGESQAKEETVSQPSPSDPSEEVFGNDYVEDDEQWRYELVRSYYSSTSPSLLRLASQADDPALDSPLRNKLKRSKQCIVASKRQDGVKSLAKVAPRAATPMGKVSSNPTVRSTIPAKCASVLRSRGSSDSSGKHVAFIGMDDRNSSSFKMPSAAAHSMPQIPCA